MRHSGIRTTALAALVLVAAVPAVAQDTKQWIYASNRLGDTDGVTLSRIDPDMPPDNAIAGIMTFPPGDPIIDITPVPSRTLPTHLLTVSRNGIVRRIPTNLNGTLSEISVGGRVRGATWIPPLNCYAITHDWNGTNSSAALSFVDRDGTQILEMGVNGSFNQTWGTGLAFCWDKGANPNSPSDDTYRLFWEGLSPGGPVDGIQMLQLTYADAVRNDGADPWSVEDDQLGPPFRTGVWATQMTTMTWNRYRTVLTVQGGWDDPRIGIDVWHGPNGHDYVIGGRARYIPTNPPTWATEVFGFDGTDMSRPGNVTMNTSAAFLLDQPLNGVSLATFRIEQLPAFHFIRCMNNYAVLTHGLNLTSTGGDRAAFYHMAPANGNSPLTFTATNTFGNNTGLVFPNSEGCVGLMMDYDGSHVYVGGDDASNTIFRYPTVANAQNLTSATAVNPPVNGAGRESIMVLTHDEQQLPNPPSRFQPLYAGTAILLSSNPIFTFDGNNPGASGNPFHSCAAALGTAGLLPVLAILGALALAGRVR